jgi:hypothetical protein
MAALRCDIAPMRGHSVDPPARSRQYSQTVARPYRRVQSRGRRCWRNKPEARAAVYANRRRIRRPRGLRLLRRRGEDLERTFAHTYETGGMRRTLHLGAGPRARAARRQRAAPFRDAPPPRSTSPAWWSCPRRRRLAPSRPRQPGVEINPRQIRPRQRAGSRTPSRASSETPGSPRPCRAGRCCARPH